MSSGADEEECVARSEFYDCTVGVGYGGQRLLDDCDA
jgi:hypothetical protein